MKKLFVTIVALGMLFGGCGFEDRGSTVKSTHFSINDRNAPNLVSVFELMKISAEGGASLEAFWYSTSFWYDGDISQCELLNQIAVADYLSTFIDSIFAGGSGVVVPDDQKAKGLKEFQTLAGNGAFYLCQSRNSSPYSFASHSYIIKKGGGLRLKLSFAVED